ncbi:MAG: glycosyltransferase family 2 protein [Planctomycetota bacterium]|nr:glycosyltransferase family 2 protein [Planctomycetota bacterium]
MCAVEQIAVAIPVYNQSCRLREVVRRCLDICPRVLVVDDGSDNEVAQYLVDMPIEVLRHQVNEGKGAAIRTAAQHLREQGVTHMITIDADGQHYPEDLPRLIEAIRRPAQRYTTSRTVSALIRSQCSSICRAGHKTMLLRWKWLCVPYGVGWKCVRWVCKFTIQSPSSEVLIFTRCETMRGWFF